MSAITSGISLLSPQELEREVKRRSAGWKGVWITLAVISPVGIPVVYGINALLAKNLPLGDLVLFIINAALVLLTLLLPFIMIGYAAGRYVHDHRLLRSARAWPSVPGVIETSSVKESSDGEGGIWFKPQLTYSFEHAGQRIYGNRWKFGDQESAVNDRKPCDEVVRSLPAGKAIEVAYDPADPTNSAIFPVQYVWDRRQTKRKFILFSTIAFGPIVILLAIYLFVVLFD